MKSKASIQGHPLHPILICFPIAFFTGTLIFDILGYWKNNNNYYSTAHFMELAGIAGALLAALPGLFDFIKTVPPDSSAKKRAARHGILNTVMLILFVIAWFYRQREDMNVVYLLAFETAGCVLLFIAGWMGGTLVFKNQIAVVNRYADSGKWKEEKLDPKEQKKQVAELDELKINQMKLVHIDGKRIVIARTEKGYVAFDDRCTHKGGSLAGGVMICGTVQCPWHGTQFSVDSGLVTAGPAKEKIKTYPIQEENGKIFLDL